MKVVEYGEKQPQVVLLLHGGGLSWWSYREVAHRLQAHYHVVLPVLDGHAESGVPFVSIEENAARLICYIEERFGGAVLAAAGLSLGGQILAEMLAERKWICQYAVLESALVVPMRMTGACVGPIVRASYGLIRKMWFAKMQARALGIPESMFADYYRDTCALRETDMIRFMQANAGYQMKEGLVCGHTHVPRAEKRGGKYGVRHCCCTVQFRTVGYGFLRIISTAPAASVIRSSTLRRSTHG